MKRIKLLTLMQILLVSPLFGQTGGVSGIITTSDGAPAEFVNVGIKGTTKGTTANNKGYYSISNLDTGTVVVVASFIGLESREMEVKIEESKTTVVDFVLKENAHQLHEVVISAGVNPYNNSSVSNSLRLQSSVLETPQNIQVVTGTALRDQQVISMSDGVTRNVSGTIRNEHWGDLYTNITSRGAQVQAFRNGFNVVNSFWGPLTEDMSYVERIEFVKGPAGFMLSHGDPAGLYNVVTKKPTGFNRGEVSMTYGSYNLLRTSVDLDGRISKDGRWLYRMNVAAQNKNSHRANEFNDRYTFSPVLAYQINDRTRLTFEYNYQNARMSDVGSFYVFSANGFATLPVGFTALPAGMPPTIIHDHSAYVNFTHEINDQWSLTAQVGRFIFNQQGSSMWPSSVDSNGTMIRAVSSWQALSRMSMGQLFVNGNFTTGAISHRVLVGLDMANKEYYADWGQYHVLDSAGAPFNSLDPYYGVPVNGYPQFDFTSPLEQRAQAIGGMLMQNYTAGYVQDELSVMDNRLRLTIAGRYTYVNISEWGGENKDDLYFTPRAALSVSIDKNTTGYVLYDQAFVPQNGVLVSGESAQPITGTNIEGGIKREWFNGSWFTSLAVYHIVKQHELTADPNSPPTSGLSIELGEKTAKGIEFDLRGTILPGLNLIANYAYTDSRVTKVAEGVTFIEVGEAVPGFATHTANAWLSYSVQTGKLKGTGISLGTTFLGDRNTFWDASPNPDQVLPNYFKMDAGIFWERGPVRVTANAFNVLNEYLYSGSYYSWLNAYYWQTEAPRNFRLGVNYKF